MAVIKARRALGLVPVSARPIGELSSLLSGGKRKFMEFAELAVRIEPDLGILVADYKTLKPYARDGVSIDELCAKHDIDPLHLIAVVGEAAMKYGKNASILLAALQFPEVVNHSVEQAMKSGAVGFRHTEALMKHHGFIPTPHGPTFNVGASAAAQAAAQADATVGTGKGLPAFEEQMRQGDRILRQEE